MPLTRCDLDRVFSIQTERTVNRDNTVRFNNLLLQIDRQAWRGSLANCRVIVYHHFDQTISIGFGAHSVGIYSANGEPLKPITEKRRTSHLKPVSQTQTGHLMC